MKKLILFPLSLCGLIIALSGYSQPGNLKGFKMAASDPVVLSVDQKIDQASELRLFDDRISRIHGLAISGAVDFTGEEGLIRVILVDRNYHEYLVYEMYSLLADNRQVDIDELCEETCLLEGTNPLYLKVEAENATLTLTKVNVATGIPSGLDIARERREMHRIRNDAKIEKLNQNLRERDQLWAAGFTEVSTLTYAERKQLYGQSKIPPGIEYYTGGVIQAGPHLKAAAASRMVDNWDWRDRHGKSWMTPVKNQGSCGSCWAFAATGATEAQVNLFFNQALNLNLAEQDVLSCSGAGTCSGGYPGTALNYIAGTGIVDEDAFPYTATNQPCANKSTKPAQLIKIAGKVDFGTTAWPREEDALKKMIIKYGPLSGGIYDWSHAIVLVGWQVVKEGDRFYTRDLTKKTYWLTVPAGSPLIGTTVWIFKNSWGSSWGDAGYVYVQTSMSNVGWTHGVLNPVQSLKQIYSVACADSDGDSYYWWGLGDKPATCNGPDTPDGDDSNPTLGPLDSYGNCIVLGIAPQANFSADKTILDAGGAVTFTDLSTNAPTSWLWSFEGGTPSSSTVKNPVVTYADAGTYDVTLTVTNANGTSTKTIPDYITVNPYIPSYCTSNGNGTREWISKVELNGTTSTSGTLGVSGYQDFTGDANRIFTVNKGGSYNMTLTPSFIAKASTEGFSVWIDFTMDYDFSDAGEQVFSANKIKVPVTRTITIPGTALLGKTRMRVSMKRNGLPLACEVFANGEVEDYTINIVTSAAKNAAVNIAGESMPGSLRVYPNPAGDKLTIELDRIFTGDECAIYSIQGTLINRTSITESVSRLNVAGLARGIYLLEVKNGPDRLRRKFIKD